MDGPYEARSSFSIGFYSQDDSSRAHQQVYAQAGDDYAGLVKAQQVPDCRVCQETFQDGRACVGPIKIEAFIQRVQGYHDSAHCTRGCFRDAEREADLRPAAEKALRAVRAVQAEAIIGTDLRLNGCRVCGVGSGTGYCGDHYGG